MKDPLQDLVNDIKKSKVSAPIVKPVTVRRQPQAPAPQVRRHNGVTVVKGEGGIRFDFGPWTGNPMADNATMLLNRFADPVQAQIAQYQRESINKAINHYTQTGQTPEAEAMNPSAHPEWNRQLTKSLDEQIVEGIKKGEIKVEGTIPGASDPGQAIVGEFNKAQIQLGGETVVGQSETDAAVIEMMKGMIESGNDELVSDATEGM